MQNRFLVLTFTALFVSAPSLTFAQSTTSNTTVDPSNSLSVNPVTNQAAVTSNISTQIIQRDRHAEYCTTLALIEARRQEHLAKASELLIRQTVVRGWTRVLNADPANHSMNSLPLYIFSLVRSGFPDYIARAWGGATLLLALVLLLFVLARIVASNRVKGR